MPNGLRVWGGTDLPYSLLMESGQITLPADKYVHQPGRSIELQYLVI